VRLIYAAHLRGGFVLSKNVECLASKVNKTWINVKLLGGESLVFNYFFL
jgi:hypothetical protein